jgi:hypothetical protein
MRKRDFQEALRHSGAHPCMSRTYQEENDSVSVVNYSLPLRILGNHNPVEAFYPGERYNN